MSVFCCVKCIIYEINREPKRIFSQSLVRVPATISHRTGVIVSTRAAQTHAFILFVHGHSEHGELLPKVKAREKEPEAGWHLVKGPIKSGHSF